MEDVKKLIESLIESSEEDTERLKRLHVEAETTYTRIHSHFESEVITLKEKLEILEADKEKADQKLHEVKEEFEKELDALKAEKEALKEKHEGEIQDYKSQLEKLSEEKNELEDKVRSVHEDLGKELEELKEVHSLKLGEAEAMSSELKVKCDHLENEVENLKAQNAGLKIKIRKIKNEEAVSSSSSSSDED